MGLHDFTIYDMIHRNAVCFKEKDAWHEVDGNKTVSFSHCKKMVDRLACGLQKTGIKKGDRIAVLGKNSFNYFLLYGAAAATGAILLPINWRLSSDEISFNINDCKPEVLFADVEFQEKITDIKNQLSCIKKFYNLQESRGNFENFMSLIDNSGDFNLLDITNNDGFVIIHTAAVAGRPRGALISHGNLACANIHLNNCFSLTPYDVHLNLLPMFHMGGLFMVTSSFHAGALNVNMSKFDALKAIELIEEKKVTTLFDFSPILASILEQQEKTGKDMKSLTTVMGIDTPETIEKYQAVSGGTFYVVYGQTETGGIAAIGRYNDRPGSAGKTVFLGRIRLVDDDDRPVAEGQTGEITMKGPLIFKGYWNLPEDTAYTFRTGWHHTGDLGRFDEDGFLWYAGRKAEKELIKPGGENVYPAEVEKVILEHPAIKHTVVFGVPDPKWKEAIMAVCALKQGKNLEPSELIKFVGGRIAGYKKPQHVKFINDFPLLKDESPNREKIKALYMEPLFS